MASSRVASSSSANSDLTRQSSMYSRTIAELQSSVSGDPSKNLGSMSMDDILRNIYGENATPVVSPFASTAELDGGVGDTSLSRQESLSLPKSMGNKTVEEVWKEISGDRRADEEDGSVFKEALPAYGEVTLEDFLARAGAVREEDIRVPTGSAQVVFGVDSVMSDQFTQQQQQIQIECPILGFGNGVEAIGGGGVGSGGRGGRGGGRGGGGRGRKRLMLDPVDRAAMQRQKRMIKNRESAARSRERKQAYTIELESLVTQLEEENSRLVRLQKEQNRKRFKQLMENLIPVVEMKRPTRPLRKTRSVQW